MKIAHRFSISAAAFLIGLGTMPALAQTVSGTASTDDTLNAASISTSATGDNVTIGGSQASGAKMNGSPGNAPLMGSPASAPLMGSPASAPVMGSPSGPVQTGTSASTTTTVEAPVNVAPIAPPASATPHPLPHPATHVEHH